MHTVTSAACSEVVTLTRPLGRCSPCTPEECKFESHQHIQRDTLQMNKACVQFQYQVSLHKICACAVSLSSKGTNPMSRVLKNIKSNKILTFLKIHKKVTSPMAGPLMPLTFKHVVFRGVDPATANLPRLPPMRLDHLRPLRQECASTRLVSPLFDDRNFLC